MRTGRMPRPVSGEGGHVSPLYVLVFSAAVLLSGVAIQDAEAGDCIRHSAVKLFEARFGSETDICWADKNTRTLESAPAKLLLYDGTNDVLAALTCPVERAGLSSADGTMISDTGIGVLLTSGCGPLHADYVDSNSLTHSDIAIYFKERKRGYTETYGIDPWGPRYQIMNAEGNQVLTLTRQDGIVEARFDCNDGTYDRYADSDLFDVVRYENCENTEIISKAHPTSGESQYDNILAGTARYHPAVLEFHAKNPVYLEDVTYTANGGHTYTTQTTDLTRILDIEYQNSEVVGTHYTCTDHDGIRDTYHEGIEEMIRTDDCGGWRHVGHPQNLMPKQTGYGYPDAKPVDHAWRAVWGSHEVAAFKAVSGRFIDGIDYRYGSAVYMIRDKAGSMVLEISTQGGNLSGKTLTCLVSGQTFNGDVFDYILDRVCPLPYTGGVGTSHRKPAGPAGYKDSILSIAQRHPAAAAFMERVSGYDEETVSTFPGESTYIISSADGSMLLEIDYAGSDMVGIRYTCTDTAGRAQSFDTGVAEMIRTGWCDGPVKVQPDTDRIFNSPPTADTDTKLNKFSGLYSKALTAFRNANPGTVERTGEISYDIYEFIATSRDGLSSLIIKYYDVADGIIYEHIYYTCTDAEGTVWITSISIIQMIESPGCTGETVDYPPGTTTNRIPLHEPEGVPVHNLDLITDPIHAFTSTIPDYTMEDHVVDYDHHLLIFKDPKSATTLKAEKVLNVFTGWTYTCGNGKSSTHTDGEALAHLIMEEKCSESSFNPFEGLIEAVDKMISPRTVSFELDLP